MKRYNIKKNVLKLKCDWIFRTCYTSTYVIQKDHLAWKFKELKLNIKSLRHRVRKCFIINMFNTCNIDNHIDNQACIHVYRDGKFNTNVHWLQSKNRFYHETKRQCSFHEQKSIFWKEFPSADHNIEFRDKVLSFIMDVL